MEGQITGGAEEPQGQSGSGGPQPSSLSAPPQPRSSAPLPVTSAPLSRNTIILGLTSLMSDISTEMVYPILPIFIRDILNAPVTALGLIEGIANGTASVVTGFSGWISDHLGRRRPVALAGYALTAVSKPFIAIANVWQVVLAARFADRLGKGIRSAPKDALIAESARPQDRGRAYGFERTMDYAGAVVGPLIGLAIYMALGIGRIRIIFLLAAIPATLAAILIMSVREPREASAKHDSAFRFNLAGASKEFKLFLLITAIFGLANSANAFLILRAQSLGLSTRNTILAYALYNAVAAAASMPAGVASDRFGRRNLLIAGFAIYAASYAGFGAANRAWLVWPLFALYGLFPALSNGVGKSLAVDTAGGAGRATAIGVYSTVIGLTQIVASYIGGVLWDKVSPASTFYLGAGLASVACVLLVLLPPARAVGAPAST